MSRHYEAFAVAFGIFSIAVAAVATPLFLYLVDSATRTAFVLLMALVLSVALLWLRFSR